MARGPNILCARLISGKSQQLILDVGHRRLTQQLRGVCGEMKEARFGRGTPRTEKRDQRWSYGQGLLESWQVKGRFKSEQRACVVEEYFRWAEKGGRQCMGTEWS